MPGLAAARPLVEVLEREWDATLFRGSGRQVGLAVQLGWRSYHTLRSRGSASGYPDRTLWKNRVVFAELKRELTGKAAEDEKRRPRPAQVSILDGLARAGAEVYVWRPSDLDDVASILGKPWRFVGYRAASGLEDAVGPHLALSGSGTTWTPGSLWIPGAGRADETWFAS